MYGLNQFMVQPHIRTKSYISMIITAVPHAGLSTNRRLIIVKSHHSYLAQTKIRKTHSYYVVLFGVILFLYVLTHLGRVTHICVSKLTTIGSDNGLSPDRRQAIIWTNAAILLIRTLGTNFSDSISQIRAFSFNKVHLKMLSGKWRPSCLGLNVLSSKPGCWALVPNWHFILGQTLDFLTRGCKFMQTGQ